MDSSESGGDDSGHEREREQEQDEDEDEDVDEDPKAKLDGFDWSAFETRYHQAMADEDAAEKANEAELAELLKFFRIWAETTVTHERDRSYKRWVEDDMTLLATL
ncbi:MAG: hypothetical protein M1838_005448 [Thelocarpon superellum]|nr:MAG: hypothetical protein M1838_005448 [Thelocarpon superellum]